MDLIKWIIAHWPEIAAVCAGSTGSGFLTKKLVDKRQNKRIQKLEHKMIILIRKVAILSKGLQTNTAFDKQLRKDLERESERYEADMRELKSGLTNIYNQLIMMKKGM